MLDPTLPPDETQRLAVLLNLNILDTAPEERFDRITRIAARMFQVPIALVTLIDGERQWFKSRVGTALTGSPRATSFCTHTMLQDGVMVVEDASADARFAANPLVLADPHVRFYAGHAIAAPDGSRIGTLCLVDQSPRQFSDDERAVLRDLASMVAHEVAAGELARTLREQRESDILLRNAVQERDMRRSKYLATATHELRTPMASVLGFSELLQKRDFDQSTGRELIDIIHAQAGVLISVTNQLLDLARIEAGGKAALRIGTHQVGELMQQALRTLAPDGKNPRIALSIDPAVPCVTADPQRLQQALVNLIGNALNYSPAGSPVEVSVAPAPCGALAGVQVRVADRGIGMSEEQVARLYEPFYRAGAMPEVPGSGLGMAIVKEIADLHDATITVDSAPGRGTVITLLLPAMQEREQGQEQGQEQAP